MTNKENEHQQAKAALSFIVPILEKYKFRWVITGGFACYVYGVDRMLTDIDIDIDTSKDSANFRVFLEEVQPHISQPLVNFVDSNYNNFNFELTIENQIIDICPMNELLIFNKNEGAYVNFYHHAFPTIDMVRFEGFELPLLTKQAIIDNKEMLATKDEWQQRDIDSLRKLLKK